MDKQELVEFINEITLLEDPPDGFYVLISARNTEARSDIYNADVIAAWMFINHTLAVNGFKVINGYSDLLTPFLGVAGGAAGALGWWSNLKVFSLDRFAPSAGGGRLPIQRYLSLALLTASPSLNSTSFEQYSRRLSTSSTAMRFTMHPSARSHRATWRSSNPGRLSGRSTQDWSFQIGARH